MKKNLVTSSLSVSEKQELYKKARTGKVYGEIWQNVGKCVFCDLKEKYIIYEENDIVLSINLYPYIDGQLLVIPRKHISSPKELSQSQWNTFRKFNYIAKKLTKEIYGHKGIWSLIREGGENAQMSVVGHLHMQIIPIDNPDMVKWNYRELKFTPLENTSFYRKKYKEFLNLENKFEKKYNYSENFQIVVDLIIKHSEKYLFQERADEYKFEPDILTLPGGQIDEADQSPEVALKREVLEEINYDIDVEQVKLLASRFSSLKFVNPYFKNKKILKNRKFLWNTYILENFDHTKVLEAKDDCKKLLWLSKEEVLLSEKVSNEVKLIIGKL